MQLAVGIAVRSTTIGGGWPIGGAFLFRLIPANCRHNRYLRGLQLVWTNVASGDQLVKLWHLSLATLVGLFTITSASAQSPAALANWGQWRGPLGTGTSPQGNPPTEWSETENVQWKVKIPGDGTSTPVIWGDKIFLLTAGPAKDLGATALHGPAARGVTLTVFQPPQKGKGGFPPGGSKKGGSLGEPAPTVPYQFVLMCLDRNSGKTLWQKAVSEQIPHEGKHPADGSFAASSAVTDGAHVIA